MGESNAIPAGLLARLEQIGHYPAKSVRPPLGSMRGMFLNP
ncbi:hypothetical protein [Nocardia suismassiliense]|nr:hypothetical protein [Nocardia suismassiliense]